MSRSEQADVPAFAQAFSQPDTFREILNGLDEPVYLVDRRRTIRFWNDACERVTGYGADEVVGRHCFDNILRHVDDNGRALCFGLCPLAHTMRDGTPRNTRVWLHHRDGHRLPVRVNVNPIRDSQDRIIGAIEMFSTDSLPEATEERIRELERLALVDPLTQLPNRRFLEMTLTSRLAELRRHGLDLSVAFVDIDNFKAVNDDHGHEIGDAALRMVANTLAANLRGEDLVARFGGEEFVILFSRASVDAARETCERLRMLVSQSSLDLRERTLAVTVSFGVTPAESLDNVESVLRRADRLLYEAKRAGRNRVVARSEPAR